MNLLELPVLLRVSGLRAIIFGILLSGQLFAPVYAAHDSVAERIRAAIESANLVPTYYRHHINITTTAGAAAIAVYRDPDAQPYDCQIDAVLIAHAIHQSVPSVEKVVVAFYQIFDSGNFWQVAVPVSSVAAFAQGALTGEEVIKSARLTACRANPLAKDYAPLSYEDMTRQLGIVKGPLRDRRTYTLVRISSLEQKGLYAGDLRRQFLHVEDSARRGDRVQTQHCLDALSSSINRRLASQERSFH